MDVDDYEKMNDILKGSDKNLIDFAKNFSSQRITSFWAVAVLIYREDPDAGVNFICTMISPGLLAVGKNMDDSFSLHKKVMDKVYDQLVRADKDLRK